VDEFGGLLDGPRARGAFLLRTVMEPPWSLRVRDEVALAVLAVVRGEAHMRFADGRVIDLRAGDLVITVGGQEYDIADTAGRPPEIVILPDGECATPDGRPVETTTQLGVRTWGNSAAGSTEVLVGNYADASTLGGRVLAGLPGVMVLDGFGHDSPVLAMLAQEISTERPGQEVVLDRLLDLLLVTALRTWFERPGAPAPGWYVAAADPVVGPALRAMQADPARRWTVAELAAQARVSRAALARRFTELVGEPPMAFLAGRRLALAADLLRDTDATLDAVARRVGYGSGFALSAAFKRVHGISPREHRERARRIARQITDRRSAAAAVRGGAAPAGASPAT
jgi:AraC-type DNA-binding domain-containing proteins